MDINITSSKESPQKERTHVRYAVQYNDRNYEYSLHSSKGHFLRNLADVVNVLEYCVTQDLKRELYTDPMKLYNFEVIRMINDVPDENWREKDDFHSALRKVVGQMEKDMIQRNT